MTRSRDKSDNVHFVIDFVSQELAQLKSYAPTIFTVFEYVAGSLPCEKTASWLPLIIISRMLLGNEITLIECNRSVFVMWDAKLSPVTLEKARSQFSRSEHGIQHSRPCIGSIDKTVKIV